MTSGAQAELIALAEKLNIPVATSLNAKAAILLFKEALNKRIPLMVRCFDKLSITTNGINNLSFVLSLSKDFFSVSLKTKT